MTPRDPMIYGGKEDDGGAYLGQSRDHFEELENLATVQAM